MNRLPKNWITFCRGPPFRRCQGVSSLHWSYSCQIKMEYCQGTIFQRKRLKNCTTVWENTQELRRHPVMRVLVKASSTDTWLTSKLPLPRTTTQRKSIVANLGMSLGKPIKLALGELDEMLARNSYKASRWYDMTEHEWHLCNGKSCICRVGIL